MFKQRMHAQVAVLATAQALFQTVSVLVMTVGGLSGAKITGNPALATLPIASMFLGTAMATFPASLWMARVGRKPGFLLGAGLGMAGGLIAAAGIWQQSLLLLAAGTLLVGCYQGFAQFYRFAASEAADDSFRPRAISFVMAGGIVAALAGPYLGRLGGPLLESEYAGSFLILAIVSVVAMGVLLNLDGGKLTLGSVAHEPARSWQQIVGQPSYMVALFGAATGYGVMILAMTATPIAMLAHHHELTAASTVIQLHVLGMFLPSFFTGTIISRLGVTTVMLMGVGFLAAHVLLTLTGTSFPSFAAQLVLLGIGWNFLYIGGTTMLTTTYRPAERGRAQAINDVTIFAVGLACSLSAGALLNFAGWQNLNLVLLPWLSLAAAALLWIRRRQFALAAQ